MSAGVAHELRNSLATIKGYLTLIGREAEAPDGGRPLPPGIEDSLTEIGREAEHLRRVLEDFLSFARPGSARLEPIDLRLVVERAAADPTLAVAEGGGKGPTIEIERRGDGRRPTISGDRQLLERALRNLLHNAVAASRETGARRVQVTVATGPHGVELTIADRGPGIPPELAERLFQPFSTGRPDGVGLGLSLTHRILTLHGASLSLEPRSGGGTSVRVMFPDTINDSAAT
jgi:signal transduction histidine kinase